MSKLREARIDGEFRRALGELLLTELKDPRMSKMASVSKVSVTQDLKYAKVYVSIYDTPEKVASTMEALESAEPFLRAKLNEMIRLRRMPVMTFVHDDSIEYSAKISKLIDEVTARDRKNAEQRGEEEQDGE
ncbi:MAG: 30S ribosome-binding factor RbfA, partial [Clostridiales bacterium]|nr:30S ribosome-binding factor RbfA [Clostridiales bacterium]